MEGNRTTCQWAVVAEFSFVIVGVQLFSCSPRPQADFQIQVNSDRAFQVASSQPRRAARNGSAFREDEIGHVNASTLGFVFGGNLAELQLALSIEDDGTSSQGLRRSALIGIRESALRARGLGMADSDQMLINRAQQAATAFENRTASRKQTLEDIRAIAGDLVINKDPDDFALHASGGFRSYQLGYYLKAGDLKHALPLVEEAMRYYKTNERRIELAPRQLEILGEVQTSSNPTPTSQQKYGQMILETARKVQIGGNQ